MTLAEFRGKRGPVAPGEAEAAPAVGHVEVSAVPHQRGHPSPLEYVRIGLVLAVVTLAEVAVYYMSALEDVLIPILITLSATKFSLVALWFMHLRFDSRLFTAFFVGGMALALAVSTVVLATFGASLV